MQAFRWRESSEIPRACAAALAALSFERSQAPSLSDLDDDDWRAALAFCDRSHLTLVLGERCEGELPPWVRSRIAGNLEANRRRIERLRQEYFEIQRRLNQANVPHIVLKGFAHAPRFVSRAELRPQTDLDLFVSSGHLEAAARILLGLGFESGGGSSNPPADHLPPFIRKTGWQWKGDYYDPDIPPVVELHFRLWDAATECFDADGVDLFPGRSETLAADGGAVPSLCAADQFGYACLHVLRHLLRGDLKAFHVYEIAGFLQRQAESESLWRDWTAAHSDSLRQLEAISCALAARWFGCRLPCAVDREAGRTPALVARWVDGYAHAPVAALFSPNKHELWLHLSLLANWRDRLRVTRRRLAPLSLPGQVDAVFVPAAQQTPRLRIRKWATYGGFLARRLLFHTRALLSTAASGLLWWLKKRTISGL